MFRSDSFLGLLFGVSLSFSSLYAQTSSLQTEEQSPGGTKFLLYTPASYIQSVPAPLLICLHGAVGIGDDLELLLYAYNNQGQRINHPDASPAKLINDNLWDVNRPFVVVSPQLKRDESIPDARDQEWAPDVVQEVIEHVKSILSIDNNRIYMTGLSLGGAGVWDYSIAYPNQLAAMAPISGVTDTTMVCQVADIPIWAFHGSIDGLVSPKFTTGMVNGINQCPNRKFKAHVNLLQARAHEGWNEVWNYSNEYPLFEWMLSNSRSDASNRHPYVNAGFDRRMLVRSEPVHLYGEYFDFDGTISEVVWAQLAGTPLTLANQQGNFLTILHPQAGSFQFTLTVTDDTGQISTDQISIEFYNEVPLNEPSVTDLILINGDSNSDIGPLLEGQVINKNTLGVVQYNVRALSNGAGSVRFRVNTDASIRSVNTNQTVTIRNVGVIEWPIPIGKYNICATAYIQTGGRGNPGLTECYYVEVYDLPELDFFHVPGYPLTELSSWGVNENGSGENPVTFDRGFQTFNITSNATLNEAWGIAGVQSSLWVRSGATLTINNAFNGVINVEANAIVHINTSETITLGFVDPTSTLVFDQNVQSLPTGIVGNVVVTGDSPHSKELASGILQVEGSMQIGNDIVLNGASSSSSIVVKGNMELTGIGDFEPVTPFNINFIGAESVLSSTYSSLHFNDFSIGEDSHVLVDADDLSLVLGTGTGGGLFFSEGAELLMGENTLLIAQSGSLNPNNQNGKVGFSKGFLILDTQTEFDSHLDLVNGMDTVRALVAQLQGLGELEIKSAIYVYDSLICNAGTINSNGFIHLLSVEGHDARVGIIPAGAAILGSINIHRYTSPGRQYRYMSFPVSGYTVEALQNYVPVTGTFNGASSGGSLSANPSLFYYEEPDWTPFPENDNDESFQVGRGYAIYMRNGESPVTIVSSGDLHQGNFTYNILPDPNLNEENDGWHLIGNPFVSSINWGGEGWNLTGINDNAYIRDNAYPGGRFLVWDGETGDEEFSGEIAQGQAFWVRSVSENPSLQIQEEAKIDESASFYRVKERAFKGLTIALKQGSLIDKVYLKFNDKATQAFNSAHDAVKQLNGYYNLSVLSADSVKTAIKNLPNKFCQDEVKLITEGLSSGVYALDFDGSIFSEPDVKIVLKDHVLDTLVNITEGMRYSFVSESHFPERFALSASVSMAPKIIYESGRLISSYENGNSWLLNGSLVPDAHENHLIPKESGIYQVVVHDRGCESISDNFYHTITHTERLDGFIFSVYPNPARNYFMIEGNFHGASNVIYALYNSIGSLIVQGVIDLSNDSHKFNIKDLVPGVYLLLIKSGSLVNQTRILVIN